MAAQRIAQGLASLGRNGDSMLMHVSPEEVSSLQRMGKPHGISLTINPDTGLPEAFSFGKFFKSIAPTIAGIVAAPATGGMSMAPILAGAATGAGLAAISGDDILTGGLMGGFGGYGGGNLAQGLAGMGATAAPAGTGSLNVAGAATGVSGAPGVTSAGFGGQGIQLATPAAQTTGVASTLGLTPDTTMIGKDALMAGQSSLAPTYTGPSYANMGEGLKSLGKEGSWDAFKAGMGPNTSNVEAAMNIGLPLGAGYMAGMMPPMPGQNEEDKYDPKRTLNLNTNTGLKLLAQGGMTSGGSSNTYGNPDGTRAQNTLNENYGLGRLNSLAAANTTANAEMGGFAKGGYLDGAGDGMSDSIPATIEGKQPARLADGEFVIPADVVSHLGNGSTKAGAKHLYRMLDKVRHARTGNNKQGKQINPNKYLPA